MAREYNNNRGVGRGNGRCTGVTNNERGVGSHVHGHGPGNDNKRPQHIEDHNTQN